MPSNLPNVKNQDSAAGTKLFFDQYGKASFEYASNDVDSTIAFFQAKGFDKDASVVVASTLLKQAKQDGVPVYSLIEDLKGLNKLQLNSLIAEILNNNRPNTSTLGYRTESVSKNEITRNIAA